MINTVLGQRFFERVPASLNEIAETGIKKGDKSYVIMGSGTEVTDELNKILEQKKVTSIQMNTAHDATFGKMIITVLVTYR